MEVLYCTTRYLTGVVLCYIVVAQYYMVVSQYYTIIAQCCMGLELGRLAQSSFMHAPSMHMMSSLASNS
jgi:hypothetical protein